MAAVQLLPYQIESFKDRSRLKLLMWSRGARKTFTCTLEIVDSIFSQEAAGQRDEWTILSAGDRQAIEAIQHAKRHCVAYLMNAVNVIKGEFVSEDGKRRYTTHEIRFPKGSVIRSVPANPDTARGYTTNFYLDEFSIHEKPNEIWRAVYPSLRGKKRMIISSTPKGGRASKFYQIVHDETSLWSRHEIDIHEAVRQGLPVDIEEEKAAMGDPDGWAQEYELKWIDEASVWLPYELIQRCEHENADRPELYSNGATFIGNDIGRRKDLWVAWVIERVGDVLWTREISVLRGASFHEQDEEMDRLIRRYHPSRIAMDQTGIGEKPVEDMQRRYGEAMVEGVVFSNNSKYVLATTLKQAFENFRWRIPINKEVRDDLHKLKRTTTLSGAPKFDADADELGHADRAWAGALALYASGMGGKIEARRRNSWSHTPDYTVKRPDRRYARMGGSRSRP